jgi:tetratricopeptide (TPR) repeat protein
MRQHGIRRRVEWAAVLLTMTASLAGFGHSQSIIPDADRKGSHQADKQPPQASQPDVSQTGGAAASTTAKSSDAGAIAPIPRGLLGQAMDLARKGDYDEAIKKYEELLQQKAKSPDAYAGLARAYLKKKDVTQAYEIANKGVEATDSWAVHVALAEVYFRQGRIPEAEKEWVGILKAGHPSARAYLGLARVRWAIEMNKTAKTFIDQAHELDPEDPEIQSFWIGTLPRAERIQYYEKYLADPSNSNPEERADLQKYLSYLKDQQKLNQRPCRLVSKVTHTETPLVRLLVDPTHMRGYGLAVDLNGTRSNFMLDTGAHGITVKRNIAERAGMSKIVETKIWGIGDRGLKDAYVGTVKSIRIGELEFQDCPVEVMESRSVAGEDGLIGADVFEDFLVDIDFPDEKLKLSELPKRPGQAEQPLGLRNNDEESADEDRSSKEVTAAKDASVTSSSGPQDRYIAPEMQSFTRVFRFGHDLLVPTKVGDVPNKLFLLDTGSLTNFISPQAAREVTKVHNDADTTVKGISGSVRNVYSANKAVLQFGNLRQENQDMTSFNMDAISESDGTEISGFFGFVMLRFIDIKIDYRDALIDFTFDPKRYRF